MCATNSIEARTFKFIILYKVLPYKFLNLFFLYNIINKLYIYIIYVIYVILSIIIKNNELKNQEVI